MTISFARSPFSLAVVRALLLAPIGLTERERSIAAILDFDPEAAIVPGALSRPSDDAGGHPEPLATAAGSTFSLTTWIALARAATPPRDDSPDDLRCLIDFLLARLQSGQH